MRKFVFVFVVCLSWFNAAWSAVPPRPWRCEIEPSSEHSVSLRLDGREVTRWHYGGDYPRPFFFPLNGPSGRSLTRMGHPGAPNHDHHRSVWFAHNGIDGLDFWSDLTTAKIRQKHWYAYEDGDEEAIIASLIGWYDEDGKERMDQDLVAAVRPLADGAYVLEIQSRFRPASGRATVSLAKTNFGFLAVRVAKSLSAVFGGGVLSDSEGRFGEQAIFGQRCRWVDYSGPVATGEGTARKWVQEGITFFDHPSNPRYPSRWHVRDDGWMGASFGFDDGYEIGAGESLVLRYQLHVHSGPYDAARAQGIATAFAALPGFVVETSDRPHHQFDVRRQAQP